MNKVSNLAFDITAEIFKSTLSSSEMKALKLKYSIKKLFKDAELKSLEGFYNELRELNLKASINDEKLYNSTTEELPF